MKEFEIEVDIVGFKPYNFVNQDTGEVVSGIKVSVVAPFDNGEEGSGCGVSIFNRPYDELISFQSAKYPCKGITKFTITGLDKNGKINITGIKPIVK